MRFFLQYQWHIFTILCCVCSITLLTYVLPIRRLYTSAESRGTAKSILVQSAEHYGLPKSDFFFTYIGTQDYRLCRREHRRGPDPLTCDWHSVFIPTEPQ